MRANFFDDFTYYAEIDGTLHELTDSHLFGRDVKRYGNTYCYAGKDFLHPDQNINPCIKMNFLDGAHLIRLTVHHVRPFKGITSILLKDDSGVVILDGKLLPGEILTHEIKIRRSIPFDLYFTISSDDIVHALVRSLVQVDVASFSGDLEIKCNKRKWVVKETYHPPTQNVRDIVHDTEYKY